jgi:ABC-2 type transport system permease protein
LTALSRLARAAPTLLRVGFAETLAYRSEFLVWVLSTNMPIIMLFLWTAVAREAPMGRFGEAEFSAYFLVTLVVRLLTGSWVVWEMNYEIRQGNLATRLLRPIHPFISYAAENLAAVPFRLLLSIPILVGAGLWLGASTFASDPTRLSLLPLSLFLAWAITFASMAMIGTLGLYWESSLAVFRLWLGLFFVLSGYTIPLELFPPWLLRIVEWLPFRFQLSCTVELALGLVSVGKAFFLLAVQTLYALLFFIAATMLWRRGLRRYAAYGG